MLSTEDTPLPSTWSNFFGPCTWKLLHSVSFTFPKNPTDEDKKNYLVFVESLAKVLPCPDCRTHMHAYINKTKPDVSSRDSFARWCVEFHNDVNRRLQKPKLEYGEIKKRYAGWTKEDSQKMLLKSNHELTQLLASPYYTGVDTTISFMALLVIFCVLNVIVISFLYLYKKF